MRSAPLARGRALAAAVQMLLLAPSSAAAMQAAHVQAARVQAVRMQAVRMQAAGFDQPKVPEMMVPVSINQLGDKVNLAASIPAERGAAQYLGVYTKSMLLRRSSVKSKHGERVGQIGLGHGASLLGNLAKSHQQLGIALSRLKHRK